MADEQQQPSIEPKVDENPNETPANPADERLEKILSIAEKTNKQVDGLSGKTRIIDTQINDLKTIVKNQQQVIEKLSQRGEDDNFDNNFGESENNLDAKKIAEIVQQTTREELNKGRQENGKLVEQKAKDRIIREALADGNDLRDEYDWNEFISGNRFSDNPQEHPLFRIRINEDKVYDSVDNAYKDFRAHYNKRYAKVPAGNEQKIADYTPSANPENSRQANSGELTAEDKKVKETFGFDDKKMREVKENAGKPDNFKRPEGK